MVIRIISGAPFWVVIFPISHLLIVPPQFLFLRSVSSIMIGSSSLPLSLKLSVLSLKFFLLPSQHLEDLSISRMHVLPLVISVVWLLRVSGVIIRVLIVGLRLRLGIIILLLSFRVWQNLICLIDILKFIFVPFAYVRMILLRKGSIRVLDLLSWCCLLYT